jgi:hypothetical protein
MGEIRAGIKGARVQYALSLLSTIRRGGRAELARAEPSDTESRTERRAAPRVVPSSVQDQDPPVASRNRGFGIRFPPARPGAVYERRVHIYIPLAETSDSPTLSSVDLHGENSNGKISVGPSWAEKVSPLESRNDPADR